MKLRLPGISVLHGRATMGSASTVETVRSNGHTRLRRSWPADEPWATLLIIHGLGEHSGRYERTGGLLADAGIHTSSFDLIGHGESAGARCHVDEFSEFLDEVEAEFAASRTAGIPAVMLGHSLGGLILLDYLTSGRPSPDLAVVSSPGLGGGKAWQRALAPILGRFLPKLAIPTAIGGDQLSRDPSVGEAYFADDLVATKTTASLGAELFAAGDRVRGRLESLTVPTLVIHGGADEVVPAAMSAPLTDLTVVERRLYPKLRHETLNEPEGPEIVAEIVAWMKEQVAPPAS